MTQKQIKTMTLILQAALIGLMFLPAGRSTASSAGLMDTFSITRSYAGTGYPLDATVYLILAIGVPAATVLCLYLLRFNLNFGSSACLQAFGAFITGCFFSSAKSKLAGTVTSTGMHYLIIFLYLVGMVLNIYGYLFTGDDSQPSSGKG